MIVNIKDLHAYYINLEKDIEKKKTTERTLNKLKFNSVERVDAIYNTDHKRFGITESFIKALALGRDAGKFPFAIFEDDILVSIPHRTLNVPDNIDALYIGTSSYGLVPDEKNVVQSERNYISAKKIDKDIYQIYNMLSAHGIIYFSKVYVDFLINSLSKAIEYECCQDMIRAQSQKFFNIYALNRSMVHQSNVIETKTYLSDMDLIDPNGFIYARALNWDGLNHES